MSVLFVLVSTSFSSFVLLFFPHYFSLNVCRHWFDAHRQLDAHETRFVRRSVYIRVFSVFIFCVPLLC